MSDRDEPRESAPDDGLAAVFLAVPDALLVFSREGRVQAANPAAQRFLDADPTGWSLERLAALDGVFAPLQDCLDDLYHQRSVWTAQLHSARRKRDLAVIASAWDGGSVVLLHDITDLLDRGRFRDEMLRLASHDLRAPLALVMNYCDLIAAELPDAPPRVTEYLDVIRRFTGRMLNLLDAILRIDQIRLSPLELHEQVDPAGLARLAVENMAWPAAQKNQQLEADVQAGMESLTADPLLIQEAMENLIGNAIKYTPDGGHIAVRAHVEAGRFHFVVEDNGVGFGQEHLPHIFEAFYRARQPGTEQVEGSGLGLNLVKTAIERHQGEVWVESREGEGSRFGFWLPLQSTSTKE
ncbi:MAG: hypothetical protein DWB42_18840 [Chloroflexi bacterium]|nr:hypothetical protein [Chloroflexota bacterium]MDL1885861.1 hypothetical protein [Anaerolineae bacterium CFX8]